MKHHRVWRAALALAVAGAFTGAFVGVVFAFSMVARCSAPPSTVEPCADGGPCVLPTPVLELFFDASTSLSGVAPPELVSFRSGQGLRFRRERSNRYPLSAPQADVVGQLQAFTITVLMRLEGRPPDRAALVSRWNTGSGGRALELGVNRSQYPYLVVSGSGEANAETLELVGTRQLRLGEDAHLSAVFVPSTRMTLYLNGRVVAETRRSVPARVFGATGPILLGNRPGAETSFGLTGVLGAVRVFSTPLHENVVRAWAARNHLDAELPSLPPVRALTRGPRYHWFAYYDKLEHSPDGRYVLGMEVGFEGRQRTAADRITVGMVDTKDGNAWIPLGESAAWSWQQGCMLQWRPGSDREVLWNDREGEGADARFVTRVLDVETRSLRTLPRPVFHVSPMGDMALGTDFARLEGIAPGQGYAGVEDPYADIGAPAESTIYQIDLDSGATVDLLSLADLAAIPARQGDLGDSRHLVNSLQYSPNGTRFLFYHRFARTNARGGSRVFTANTDGSELFLLTDEDVLSHYTWRDTRHILIWSGTRGGYALYEDGVGYVRTLLRYADGHETILPGGEWMLSDTYPDASGFRELFLYHLVRDEIVVLGRFLHPSRYGGGLLRVDAHPRVDRLGRTVVFDSPHEQGRQLHEIDIRGVTGY